MKKNVVALAGAALLVLVLVATATAAGPRSGAGPGAAGADRAGDAIPTILGLTHDEIMALRHEGRSLAQIAERQEVDPQLLVNELAARWTERIEARVAAGALTPEQAAALKAQVETQAKHMVYRTTLGGMQGGAVGAGPGMRNGDGQGPGAAGCTEPMHGAGAMNGGGRMHGAGAGNRMGPGHHGGGFGPGSGNGTGPNGNGGS
jgi:hypothetical protein